ncbi:MAG: Peptidase M29 aminopeptidase II [Parcubacteria group bacterium GW2011_GWB1_46_8]|nr:MAG: Peptidase M29 aminopeptidase II [Parcubacteria group bacterium GW2011_GWB1_46_8]
MKKLITGFSKEIVYVDQMLVNKIAGDMVNISTKVRSGENVLIHFEPGGRQLALELARLSALKGARVYYHIQDRELNAEIMKNSGKKDIVRFFSFDNAKFYEADVTFIIRSPKTAFAYESVPSPAINLFNDAMNPALMEYRVNHSRWCLIYWPTPEEADIEGMSYENYVRLFFASCNQPWDKIQKTQDKLKNILDKGKLLTLTANPNDKDPRKRTKLEMSIKGMTFSNCTIDKNYPGAEIFSAPIKNSVNGQVFAEGMYSYNGKRMKNISLRFENGRVVSATAQSGEKYLLEIIDTDEGSRYLGEIALGTNPGLRQRLFNPLLNEKVGGSFHLALGRSYQNETYKGKTVKLFNGNISKIHWDITIMMRPEYGGGEVIVDGETIQKNGKFTVRGLGMLNG